MKEVYIWGIGDFYKRNEDKILEKYQVAGYLDNDINKQGTSLNEKTVQTPDKISNFGECKIIIMTKQLVSAFFQLIHLDVNPQNIYFGVSLFPETELERRFAEYGILQARDNRLIYNYKFCREIEINSQAEMEEWMYIALREHYRKSKPDIGLLNQLTSEPVNRDWGMSRGHAIDRVYIESFLEKHKSDIHGVVLEIGDNKYTLRYGKERVVKSKVLHVKGWQGAFQGNLETGEGLEHEEFDTVILTQTLMFIYDLKSVVNNLYKIMKKNGTALITVSGISQISRYDADNWGSFWGFHKDALERLFVPVYGKENVEVQSFGNVKTAVAMLYGLCAEEIEENLFSIQDPDYPIISTVRVVKN